MELITVEEEIDIDETAFVFVFADLRMKIIADTTKFLSIFQIINPVITKQGVENE